MPINRTVHCQTYRDSSCSRPDCEQDGQAVTPILTLRKAAMAAWSDLPDEIWGLIFTRAITCHTRCGYQTALEPACCLQTTCRRFRDVVTSSCCSAVWQRLRVDSTSATDNMPVIISVAHLVKDMDLLYDTLDKAPFTEFFKRLWARSAGSLKKLQLRQADGRAFSPNLPTSLQFLQLTRCQVSLHEAFLCMSPLKQLQVLDFKDMQITMEQLDVVPIGAFQNCLPKLQKLTLSLIMITEACFPLMDTIRPLDLELDIMWNSCNYLCEPNMMAHMTSLSVTNLYLWNFPNLPWDVMAQVHVQHTFRAVVFLPQLIDKVPQCQNIDITAPEAVIHFPCLFRHASHVVLTECESLQSFRTLPARSCWYFEVHTGNMRLAADFQALQPQLEAQQVISNFEYAGISDTFHLELKSTPGAVQISMP